MSITVDAKHTKEIIKRLKKRLPDARPIFDIIQPHLEEAKEKQFNSKGAHLGSPWAKRKQNYPWPILQKTGKMRKSFRVKYKSVRQMVYGTTRKYYPFHQLGTSKMPARVMLAISPDLQNIITKEFKKFFDDLMK